MVGVISLFLSAFPHFQSEVYSGQNILCIPKNLTSLTLRNWCFLCSCLMLAKWSMLSSWCQTYIQSSKQKFQRYIIIIEFMKNNTLLTCFINSKVFVHCANESGHKPFTPAWVHIRQHHHIFVWYIKSAKVKMQHSYAKCVKVNLPTCVEQTGQFEWSSIWINF